MSKKKILRMKDLEQRRRVLLRLCVASLSIPLFVAFAKIAGGTPLMIIAVLVLAGSVSRMFYLRRRERKAREAAARAIARRLELAMAFKNNPTRDRRAISTFKMNW